MKKLSRVKKIKRSPLLLPLVEQVSGNGKLLTVYELGNLQYSIWPTDDDLKNYRDLIRTVAKQSKNGKDSAIFVPAGLVRVTQYSL